MHLVIGGFGYVWVVCSSGCRERLGNDKTFVNFMERILEDLLIGLCRIGCLEQVRSPVPVSSNVERLDYGYMLNQMRFFDTPPNSICERVC